MQHDKDDFFDSIDPPCAAVAHLPAGGVVKQMTITEYLEQFDPLFNTTMSTSADYDINQAREEYIAREEAAGNRIVIPGDNELQIDIDANFHYVTFIRKLESVARNIGNVDEWKIKSAPSRSGFPCQHITITAPFALDTWQRIALQASLGSDPMRELLSCIRALRGDDYPTLFVEKGHAE